ncbi:MAG: TonB-dependent receptor [Bacteroidetes bacterium]|nr:TonB-dependent receptor [Bacteroidota bacterium]
MRQSFTYFFVLLSFAVLSQNDTLTDTLRKKQKAIDLYEVIITTTKDNSFGISRLNNVEGTAIYAGKKSEAVYVGDLNANLAANNSRQIFAKVAGINIFENDGSGSQIGIGGRGLNPNRISNFNTRQNGYDISADALGYPESYYTPPTEAIERIEILRGAASLQYGTQFGGMINYKFEDAPRNKKISGNFRQTGASFGFLNSFNQLSGTVKKVSYNTFYQYKHYDGWRPSASLNHHNAFASVNYRVNERLSVKGEYTFLNYVAQQPGGLTDKQFYEDPYRATRNRNWFRVNWNLFSATADYQISDRTRLNFIAFGLMAGRDALGNLGRPDRLDDTSTFRNLLSDVYNNYGSELRLLHRYSFLGYQSNILIGARAYKGNTIRKQGDADKGSDADFSFINPDNLENSSYLFPSTNYAVFAENIFQLTKNWSITPGIRFENITTSSEGYYRLLNKDGAGNHLLDMRITDNRSNTRSFLLGGIGTQFKITRGLEMYANFSQNYRSINFNDMRVNNPNYQVDPKLKDETGYTADGGLRGVIRDLLYFDISGFLLQYNNRIGTILTTDTLTYQIIRYRTNVSDSRNAGIEAFAEIDWIKLANKQSKHKLSTFVNISFINAIYTGGQQPAFKNKKVEYVPDMIVRTGITYAYKKFSITAQYAYTSEQFSDATNAESSSSAIYGIIPAYSVVDVSAGYSWKRFGIFTGVNNVTNSLYFTRRTEGYPGPGILPADPINGYLTLQFKF